VHSTATQPSGGPRSGDAFAAALLVEIDLVLDSADAGHRLDQALAGRLPEYSRSCIQGWIDAGMVRVDGGMRRARDRMHGGECIAVRAAIEPVGRCEPEPVPLHVIFEDEHLLVIDKPAGLVVHPAAGNWHGTLQNGLLHRDPTLDRLPRCGIVHRLDKDTSGLLVVARTALAHKSLTEQLQARTVKRDYRALVVGELPHAGQVDAPIGRHPTRRTSMAVVPGGRPSVTDYQVLAGYPGHSLLAVQLHTGRTHQIRVHMTHIGHPLVGDPVYGGRQGHRRPPQGMSGTALEALRRFPRQALHAIRLALVHPERHELVSWEVPMAQDMADLIALMEADGAD
jgi:23S rRNA pseudouridine1911/1915/1917 synthase